MTATARPLSTGSVPPHALRRGTRGFAAVVLFLTGMAVLATAFLVLPGSAIEPQLLIVLVPLAIAFGIAHLVAIVGVLRRRAWVVPLSLYLAAIGAGIVGFGLLLLRAGIDPVTGLPVAGDAAWGTAGLLLWLAGSWAVAARFTVRGMAGPDGAPADDVDPRAIEAAGETGPRRGALTTVAQAG